MRVLLVLALVGYARCLPLQVTIGSYINGQVAVYNNVLDLSNKSLAKLHTTQKPRKNNNHNYKKMLNFI